jgi:hypothetical protein
MDLEETTAATLVIEGLTIVLSIAFGKKNAKAAAHYYKQRPKSWPCPTPWPLMATCSRDGR